MRDGRRPFPPGLSWERSHAEQQIDELETIADPGERFAAVLRMATEFSQSGGAVGARALMGELEDRWVRGAVSRVNGARVDRLAATRESPKSRMKPAEREDFLSELRSRLIDGS